MQTNVAVAALLLCILTFFGEVGAQTIPGDVTFEVPINLTRLSPSLSKVAVTCALGLTSDPTRLIDSMDTTYSKGDVFFNRVELPVSAGQVVTTARVVIAGPSSALFKPGAVLNYQCALSAMSSEPMDHSAWYPLDQKVPLASLQVSPVPVPIIGTYTW